MVAWGARLFVCVAGAVVWFSVAAGAAEKAPGGAVPMQGPAVDGANTKIDFVGGSASNTPIYATSGLLAVPVGHSYGFEAVGAGGTLDGRGFGAAGANFFWRDPARARLGVTADYLNADTSIGNVNAYRFGAEGEYYFERFTLRGHAGVVGHGALHTTVGSRTLTAFDSNTGFFDQVTLAYYVLDDLKLSIGHSYSNNKHAGTVGAEWGFRVGDGKTMAALFADASFASGNTSVFGGLRFYTGQKDKTLIRRNREDDITLVQFLGALTLVADAVKLAIPAIKQAREGPR